MDSPVRQQLKRNDYLRHKLFRKINRRRRAKRQLDIEAPAKELKKRLRLKRTFEDGKDGDRISKSSDFSDEQLSRLVVDNSRPDPRYIYDPSDPMRIGSYMNVLEKNGWSINDPKAMLTLRELYDIDQTATPFDHFAFDAGPLPEVTVKPDYNKWYNLILMTYYPFHKGRYSLTGHSELSTPGGNRISTNRNDADYNFILNNCSDATRKALELAYHKAINPFLFTTPGDVKDFAELKLGGKTKTVPSGRVSITEIPVKLALLLQISKYAKQIEDTGKYAGGKDGDVVTNSRGDSYRLDPNLPMWNDDGTLNAVIDNVNIYSPRGYREAYERRVNNMLLHTENPLTGYAPGLKLTFPEFDLLAMSDLAKPFVAKGLPKLMNQWRLAKSFKPISNFVPTLDSNLAGIRYAYSRNPELANIGNLEEYNNYIRTVFPESKVRDINYHMGPKGLQELKPSTGEVWNTNPGARGIYVTPDKSYTQKIRKFTTDRLEKPSIWTYIKRNLTPGGWDKANETFTDIYPVIVDTKNPLYTKGTWTWGIKDNKYQSLMDKYDAIVNSGPKWYQNVNSMPETIVPKTEQTLILGSDADIEGFRKFMSNYANGKDSGIHIKPENRGKFTRLKKRTGHSTAWFKAHGTPAQKKMAVFALNSKRWHH